MLHMHLFSGTPAADSFLLLAQIGGFVLMFIAGLETDIDRMREASVTAFLVAQLGVIWPFFLGAGAAYLLGLPWSSALFLGGALTATSVSISARTLMDAGKMTTPEASVIFGAAVIDDVMGLFVLAFLAASCSTTGASAFGVAPMLSNWLQQHVPFAAQHPLFVQMTLIAICVEIFFFVSYGAAQRWIDPLMRLFRTLDANEAVTSCVLALVLLFAVSAEWLGSVAGITGAYLLGYVFAGAKLKTLIERTFLRHRPRTSDSALLCVHRIIEQFSRIGWPLAAACCHLSCRCRQQTRRLRHGGAWHGYGTSAKLPRWLRNDFSR